MFIARTCTIAAIANLGLPLDTVGRASIIDLSNYRQADIETMAKAKSGKIETTLESSLWDKLAERKEALIVAALVISVIAVVIAYEVYARGIEPYGVSEMIADAKGDIAALEKLQEKYRDTEYEPRIAFELAREIMNKVEKTENSPDSDEPVGASDEEKLEAYTRAYNLLDDVVARHKDSSAFTTYFIIADLIGTCKSNRDFYNAKLLDKETQKARDKEDEEIENAIEEAKKAREEVPGGEVPGDGEDAGDTESSDGDADSIPDETGETGTGDDGSGEPPAED